MKADRRTILHANAVDNALGCRAGKAQRGAAFQIAFNRSLMPLRLADAGGAVRIGRCAARGIERHGLRRARRTAGIGIGGDERTPSFGGGKLRRRDLALKMEPADLAAPDRIAKPRLRRTDQTMHLGRRHQFGIRAATDAAAGAANGQMLASGHRTNSGEADSRPYSYAKDGCQGNGCAVERRLRGPVLSEGAGVSNA